MDITNLIPGVSQTKIIVIFVSLAVLAASIGGLVWYVDRLEKRVAVQRANNVILKDAVDKQSKIIDQLQEDQKKIQEIQADLRKKVVGNTLDVDNLRKRFAQNPQGKPRDFGEIAIKNPAAVEKSVNKGVAEANRCLEIASGAPLTEKEKNAKLKTEINSICPALANPNYKPIP